MSNQRYNPRDAEPRWQALWESKGLFHADENDPRPKYDV